jgi:hypothetical protein
VTRRREREKDSVRRNGEIDAPGGRSGKNMVKSEGKASGKEKAISDELVAPSGRALPQGEPLMIGAHTKRNTMGGD